MTPTFVRQLCDSISYGLWIFVLPNLKDRSACFRDLGVSIPIAALVRSIRAGHDACWYSCRLLLSRSGFRMSKRSIFSGAMMGEGSWT